LASVGLFLAITAFLVAGHTLVSSYTAWTIRSLVALGCHAFWRGGHWIMFASRHIGCSVYDFAEDLVVVWPPRTGTSGALTDWILSQPGVTVTSAHPDLHNLGAHPDLYELGEDGEAS
jgi:hypothetical protein